MDGKRRTAKANGGETWIDTHRLELKREEADERERIAQNLPKTNPTQNPEASQRNQDDPSKKREQRILEPLSRTPSFAWNRIQSSTFLRVRI